MRMNIATGSSVERLLYLLLAYPDEFELTQVPCCLRCYLDLSDSTRLSAGSHAVGGQTQPIPRWTGSAFTRRRSRMTREPFDAKALASPPSPLSQRLTPVL